MDLIIEEEQTEETEIEFTLKVFQTSENNYVIGMVDLNGLNNAMDYAFNIHNVLFITYDDEVMNDYIIFEDTLVNSFMIYNLNKSKVLSMFDPTDVWNETYFEMMQELADKYSNNNEEIDQDYNNNFYEVGQVQ